MSGLFEAEGFFEFFGEVELDGVAFETLSHPGVGDFGFGGEDGTAVVRELGDIRHGFRVALKAMRNQNFQLFGVVHLAIIAAMFLTAGLLAWWSRRWPGAAGAIRVGLGLLLLANELVYYVYKFQKGWFQFPAGLPLQLCDLILWLTVAAMLFKPQFAFEFCFFAGLAGTSMAVLTPDLWDPFPSYPTVYFFLAHCGIVACILYLWWSKAMRPLPGCVWRVMLALNGYALGLGLFNWVFATNYMYLCRKPAGASLLDFLGPWPVYLVVGEVVAAMLFSLLALPFRERKV